MRLTESSQRFVAAAASSEARVGEVLALSRDDDEILEEFLIGHGSLPKDSDDSQDARVSSLLTLE